MIEDKRKCSGCYACKNICPQNAIEMCEDNQGFCYPEINSDLCIECGLCSKKCPILNAKKEEKKLPTAYAIYNKNEIIRNESSSGGVFTELSKIILKENGIVFGASFNKNFDVIHILVENEKDLKKLRGSKYVQSDIGNSFYEAKKALKLGKKVLFTGTPCQIEGLYSFLGKDYSNLYTQDIICHGVPSKKIWQKYIKERKEKDNCDDLKKVLFRDKSKHGWSRYEVTFKYGNGKITRRDHNEDIFMKLFLSDKILRPSCYDCKFKKKHRISDITIADFWGIDNIRPELNDEKGISLVLAHSLKGIGLLEQISKNVCIEEVSFEEAIKYNQSMLKSANIENYEPKIYEDYNKVTLQELINKYL